MSYQARGTIFQQGSQDQKTPVRHKRRINFLTQSQILGGQLTHLTRTSRTPVSCTNWVKEQQQITETSLIHISHAINVWENRMTKLIWLKLFTTDGFIWQSVQHGDMVVPRTRTQLGCQSFHVAVPVPFDILSTSTQHPSFEDNSELQGKPISSNKPNDILWEHFVQRVYCTYLLTNYSLKFALLHWIHYTLTDAILTTVVCDDTYFLFSWR